MLLPWTRRRKIVESLEAYCEAIRRKGVTARTPVQVELDLRYPDPVAIYLTDLLKRNSFRAA